MGDPHVRPSKGPKIATPRVAENVGVCLATLHNCDLLIEDLDLLPPREPPKKAVEQGATVSSCKISGANRGILTKEMLCESRSLGYLGCGPSLRRDIPRSPAM